MNEGLSGLPPVALALLNWNGWGYTVECLDSVAGMHYPTADVILCDNASTDDSVPRIVRWAAARKWPTRVATDGDGSPEDHWVADQAPRLLVVRGRENRGFAGGTNVAIRHALVGPRRYRYVWVLNTDTTVEATALGFAVSALEARADAAAAQSLLIWARDRDLVDSAGMRLLRRGGAVDMLRHRPRKELESWAAGRNVVPVFGCCGAAALYRLDALRDVGLFDERFFSGYEDVDLACRLQDRGYGALLVTCSVVYHVGGPSRDMRKRGWMWWLGHRNKLWMVARWYPRLLGFLILAVGIPRTILVALRTSDVSFGDWVGLAASAWREWRGGAPECSRRRILRRATSSPAG